MRFKGRVIGTLRTKDIGMQGHKETDTYNRLRAKASHACVPGVRDRAWSARWPSRAEVQHGDPIGPDTMTAIVHPFNFP